MNIPEGITMTTVDSSMILEVGYDAAHDDDHAGGELALAAICYATPVKIYTGTVLEDGFNFVDPWPWNPNDDKRLDYGGLDEKARAYSVPDPCTYTMDQCIDLLVKAGALIAAEIDRLQRVAEEEKRDNL